MKCTQRLIADILTVRDFPSVLHRRISTNWKEINFYIVSNVPETCVGLKPSSI